MVKNVMDFLEKYDGEVGDDMPSKYKETACGGCALTSKGVQIAAELMEEV